MNVERLAEQLAAYEPRSTLDAALRFYGVEEGPARRQVRDARSNVEATVAVLAAQVNIHAALPRTVDELHARLYPSDPNRIDEDGKLVWRDGVATVTFGAQAGTSLVALVGRFLVRGEAESG